MLADFVNFYNNIKNPILVRWRMNGTEFGFKAIGARRENFGIYDLSFLNAKSIDLHQYLYYSLQDILKANDCDSPYFLGGKEEAIYFDKRNYNAVKLSTESKSIGINNLLKLIIKDKIEINSFCEE